MNARSSMAIRASSGTTQGRVMVMTRGYFSGCMGQCGNMG